jgi:hypothetical protein
MKRSNFWTNLLATLIMFVICFIPTWVFLGVRFLLAPHGFWQNFVVVGFGFFCLGAFQLVGLIIFLAFVANVILGIK